MNVPVVLYPCQHLALSILLLAANLVGVKWYLIVVLILYFFKYKLNLSTPPAKYPLEKRIALYLCPYKVSHVMQGLSQLFYITNLWGRHIG